MNKPSILVVEDDVPVRCLITTTLKTHGYKYLTASNGETAIMMTTSHNPDIMLLDLGLPDIDGIEVIRSVRTWSNLPIIVLSARSEDSDKIEALDNGADDYLTKPFSVDELLAPLPHAAGTATPLMPQAGVGLCAFKTTDQKAEAAAVFLRWLTEQQRNLEFAADTGYMPVSSAAFDAIADYPFEQQSYQRLYDVYNAMRIQNTPVSEPGIVGYHAKTKTFYDSLRQRQKDYPQRLAGGETLETLTAETWQLLCDNA